MKMNRRRLLTGSVSLAAVPCLGALGTNLLAGEVAEADMPEQGIILVAELKAKPGEEQAVKQALVAMVAPTRKEDGCLCYNLHQSAKDKTQFMFYEQWASQAALDAHGATSNMKAMQKAIQGRLEKGGATRYQLLG
jgi:quinol monooxygenase YgiN